MVLFVYRRGSSGEGQLQSTVYTVAQNLSNVAQNLSNLHTVIPVKRKNSSGESGHSEKAGGAAPKFFSRETFFQIKHVT